MHVEAKRLDFSAMDFSEFIDEIMSNVQMPSVDVQGNKVQAEIQTRMQNYYE